ncbi:uncharacterized protein LOC132751335 [Ruditapes philippinarum]|uniref:uncharacterized protein LOC132751335 n=1 Tax=Ruditapes philippinarum TaxID=129788 RepID=UPI00295BCF92|nr:uncharacterized protein LOC132751335 [Ruditapes philippinarum]
MTSVTPSTTAASHSTSTSGPNTSGAQLVLDGPNSSTYKSRVELKCISLPTAQRYIWKYNHSTSLPSGVSIEKEIVISPLAGEDKLVIAELDESKVGVYSCEAIINGQTIEKTHFIAITKEKPTAHIVKTFIPPYFALVCTTTGYPPPQIGWTFVKAGSSTGSVGLPGDADVTRKGLVSIVAVDHYKSASHDGSWYCAATNSLGDVITETDIP